MIKNLLEISKFDIHEDSMYLFAFNESKATIS
jgi:hypothetical protein